MFKLFQDVPTVQKKPKTRPEKKNPFKEIISALQSSFSLIPVISTSQHSPTLPVYFLLIIVTVHFPTVDKLCFTNLNVKILRKINEPNCLCN